MHKSLHASRFYLCRFRQPRHRLLEVVPVVAAAPDLQPIAVLGQEVVQCRPDRMRVPLGAQRYLWRGREPHQEVHQKLDHDGHLLEIVVADVAVGAPARQFQPDFD